MARGLPKKYIKKYGVSKKAWAAYRRSKGSRSNPRKKTSKRRRRVARRKKSRARRAASNPLLGYAMFALGAGAGEWITDQKIRPYLEKNHPGWGITGFGAALLAGGYLVRKYTRKRGLTNLGTGIAAYMAAKGAGMLYQAFQKK